MTDARHPRKVIGETFLIEGWARSPGMAGRRTDTILAALSHAGLVIVPREATPEMIEVGVQLALNISIGGKYRWPDYIADIYRLMLAARLGADDAR